MKKNCCDIKELRRIQRAVIKFLDVKKWEEVENRHKEKVSAKALERFKVTTTMKVLMEILIQEALLCLFSIVWPDSYTGHGNRPVKKLAC